MSKYTSGDFAAVKKAFLQSERKLLQWKIIPPQLVLNWDQTGLNIVPSSSWTMDKKGSKTIELIGLKDKHQLFSVALLREIFCQCS